MSPSSQLDSPSSETREEIMAVARESFSTSIASAVSPRSSARGMMAKAEAAKTMISLMLASVPERPQEKIAGAFAFLA